MKPKTMILMGLAITCGLGASWMTSKLIAGRGSEEQETVTILVAKQNLNVGELFKEPKDFFVNKTVNAKEVPEGALRDPESLKDKIMKKSLRKGDHITGMELYGKDEQLDIPDGYKAIGIRVNLETSASGFASLPRSHVDIIQTVKLNNNDINQSYVQVLLEDVLVLAADTDIGRDKGPAAQAQVVTVALRPDDAMKVVGARTFGELTLSLRKPGDHAKAEKTYMTFAEMRGLKPEQQQVKNTTPEAPVQPPVAIPEPPVVGDTKPETTVPEVPQPKIITTELEVFNGKDRTAQQFHRTEDGQPVASPEASPAQAAPNEVRPQITPKRLRSSGPQDL